MTGILVKRGQTAIEMTSDPDFEARIRRLVVISSVALGVITVLSLNDVGGAWGAAAMIGLGWASMPAVLAASLRRPQLRYLLAVPSALVSLGVLATARAFAGDGGALAGWYLITAGIWLGAGLGMWFWFRWMPVPEILDRPFSKARWSLIGVHITLIVAGAALVFLAGVI